MVLAPIGTMRAAVVRPAYGELLIFDTNQQFATHTSTSIITHEKRST
jgi:hypothetical protein